jgi:hypothetical protein
VRELQIGLSRQEVRIQVSICLGVQEGVRAIEPGSTKVMSIELVKRKKSMEAFICGSDSGGGRHSSEEECMMRLCHSTFHTHHAHNGFRHRYRLTWTQVTPYRSSDHTSWDLNLRLSWLY